MLRLALECRATGEDTTRIDGQLEEGVGDPTAEHFDLLA